MNKKTKQNPNNFKNENITKSNDNVNVSENNNEKNNTTQNLNNTKNNKVKITLCFIGVIAFVICCVVLFQKVQSNNLKDIVSTSSLSDLMTTSTSTTQADTTSHNQIKFFSAKGQKWSLTEGEYVEFIDADTYNYSDVYNYSVPDYEYRKFYTGKYTIYSGDAVFYMNDFEYKPFEIIDEFEQFMPRNEIDKSNLYLLKLYEGTSYVDNEEASKREEQINQQYQQNNQESYNEYDYYEGDINDDGSIVDLIFYVVEDDEGNVKKIYFLDLNRQNTGEVKISDIK